MMKLSFSKTWKEALNLETKKKVYGFIYQNIYFFKNQSALFQEACSTNGVKKLILSWLTLRLAFSVSEELIRVNSINLSQTIHHGNE